MAKKRKQPRYIESELKQPMLNYHVYYMSASEILFYNTLLLFGGGFIGVILFGGLFKQDGIATKMTFISNIVVFLIVGVIANRVFIK